MRKRFLSWLGGVLLMCAMMTVPAFAGSLSPLPLLDPGETSSRFYQNPQTVNNIGDPFILPVEGKYQVFATSASVGFYTWNSEDLKTYGSKKKALQRVSWATGDYWAPEVYAYQGKYVMLFSARRAADKSLRIGIAVSDKPEGPYKDPLDAPLLDPGYAVIDASLFLDEDGTPYLYYARDCSENVVGLIHQSDIYVVQLAQDLLSTAGEPVKLTAPEQPWETGSSEWRWNEGPAVVKHAGKYYLFYSGNYFEDKAYDVGVAVSESPAGPFVKADLNPILRYAEADGKVVISGPGHNSFFTVGDELFTAYHTHTYPTVPSGNRQLNYDRAGFHADGTAYINGPTQFTQLLPYAMLDVKNIAPLAKITFEGKNGEGLTDGDYCISPASRDYAFRGTKVELTFDKPVKADTVILYPGPEATAKGKLIINGSYETPVDLTSYAGIPGGCQIISFDIMEVNSVQLVLDGEATLGEVIVLGSN
jgi:GH43 family beta-xylosidase